MPQRKVRTAHRKRKQRDWGLFARRALFLIIFCCYVIGAGWTLLAWEGSRIKNINISGVQRVQEDSVRIAVENILNGTKWQWFSRAQFFFVNKKEVEESVRSVSGIIEDVIVEKHFPTGILIFIQEWEHVYTWCTQQQCYVINDDGTIGRLVQESDSIMQDNPVTRIIDRSNTPIKEGTRMKYVNPENILRIVDGLRGAGIDVQEDSVYVAHRRAQEMSFQTKEGWVLRIGLDQPLHRTLTAITSVLAHGIPAQERDILEEVDVRLGRKVFYRIKKDNGDASAEVQDKNENRDVPLDE